MNLHKNPKPIYKSRILYIYIKFQYSWILIFTNSINVQSQSVPSYWHCIVAFSTSSVISVCFIQYVRTQLWGILITGKILQILFVIFSNIFNELLLLVGTSMSSISGGSVVSVKSSLFWNKELIYITFQQIVN